MKPSARQVPGPASRGDRADVQLDGGTRRCSTASTAAPPASGGLADGRDRPPRRRQLAILEPFRDQLPPKSSAEPAYTRRCRSPSAPTAPRSARPRSSSTTPARNRPRRPQEERQGRDAGDRARRRQRLLERIINPFVANLRQIGIDASYRLIDPAQMQERQKRFDYESSPAASSCRSAPRSSSASSSARPAPTPPAR